MDMFRDLWPMYREPIKADKGRRGSFEKIAKSKNTKRTKKAGKKK